MVVVGADERDKGGVKIRNVGSQTEGEENIASYLL